MNDTRELLVDAKGLISDESHWTQGLYARDQLGFSVTAHDTTAVKWCAIGALRAKIPDHSYDAYYEAADALDRCSRDLTGEPTVRANDHATHATVMKIYDCAITRATEETS